MFKSRALSWILASTILISIAVGIVESQDWQRKRALRDREGYKSASSGPVMGKMRRKEICQVARGLEGHGFEFHRQKGHSLAYRAVFPGSNIEIITCSVNLVLENWLI